MARMGLMTLGLVRMGKTIRVVGLMTRKPVCVTGMPLNRMRRRSLLGSKNFSGWTCLPRGLRLSATSTKNLGSMWNPVCYSSGRGGGWKPESLT